MATKGCCCNGFPRHNGRSLADMTAPVPSRSSLLTKLVVSNVVFTAAMGPMLFLVGRDWHWPQAWIFLVEVLVLNLAVHLWLLSYNPALLAERLGGLRQPNQTKWDRLITPFALLAMIGWFVLIALDHRWHWSMVPIWLQVVGAFGIAGSLIVTAFVFRANSFAAPVVKIQAERGHSVADTGPYAFVRHPMYSGAILFLIGAPLLLSSWYALIGSAMTVVFFGARAVGEERLLTKELDGYPEYAARVRYRLLPYVW